MIGTHFGSRYNGIALQYVEQTEQLGTGHAVLQCAKHIEAPFLVMNGDDLYDPADLRKLAQAPWPAALVKGSVGPARVRHLRGNR